jgi:hypothetical protein
MFQFDRIPDSPARARAPEPPASAGFVLVGVVIMVLALTILGLSLFSLSSYEAQFMNRSLDEQQALQSAIGGIDRARFALAVAPESLAEVKKYLPYENVIYARATQLQGAVLDSMSVLIGGGNDINLTVTAEYHHVRRTVSGNYRADHPDNYYKRLLTIGAGGIELNPVVNGHLVDPPGTVVLGLGGPADSVWEFQATSPWTSRAKTNGSSYGINHRSVSTPSIDTWVTNHTWTNIPYNSAGYMLTSPPGQVGFLTTNNLASTEFSSRSRLTTLTVNVNGRVVWYLPRGLRADLAAEIKGNPATSCLVIVAHNGEDLDSHLYGAIWFFAGVTSQIPLILVSDENVKLEQFNAPGEGTELDNLSIFAHYLLLTGPTTDPSFNTAGNLMRLTYGSPSVMDALIDDLMTVDALPNSVSPIRFPLRQGSWHVTE